MNKKEYIEYAKKHAPSSPSFKNTILAFIGGGSICLLGQIIYGSLMPLLPDENAVKSIVTSSLILLSCFLTGIGIYDKLAKHFGAGMLVPITGFANSMMSPVMDYKTEGLILGAAAKMFIIAGPVIVYGVLSSVIYGLIYYLSISFL